jgi:hypothetical protein
MVGGKKTLTPDPLPEGEGACPFSPEENVARSTG